ncbi:hypothetical protein LA080_011426 [Diaporthe eres]|nr:hypothetical protein LA080_011426 [Diaporthe eres]
MSSILLAHFMDKIRVYLRSPKLLLNLSPAASVVDFEEKLARDCGLSDKISAWHQVDSELSGLETVHHRFWWRHHAGRGLAILLQHAGYPRDLQYRDLKFFADVVAPYLGVSEEETGKDTLRWPSFMTDDGTPLELSWDWGTTDQPPMIRYSIEPLVQSLPDMHLEWFNHFQDFFNPSNQDIPGPIDAEDHSTSIFYAFDLSALGITVKTYFFPKFRANLSGLSNLDVLSQAIQSAPYVTRHNLEAWDIFQDFCSEERNMGLEHEMLAIDHIDPLKSRIKIYFRSRETSFRSVIDVMTLGGRLKNQTLYQGLKNLERLWNSVFDTAPNQSLPPTNHRTAGLLYNIEFKLGDAFPVAKIYLPVRHYSSSDDAIIRGLDDYFKYHNRGKYMPQYFEAMRALFNPQVLKTQAGAQTYVGCAVRPDGKLRVVSYIKPRALESLPHGE